MVEFIFWVIILPILVLIVYVRERALGKREIVNEEDRKKWSIKTRKNVGLGIFSGCGLVVVIVLIAIAVFGALYGFLNGQM
jgi:hypothetical protein